MDVHRHPLERLANPSRCVRVDPVPVRPAVLGIASLTQTWIGKLGLGDKALLMMARVRRAWAAVGLYYRQVEQGRSKIVALSDLDTMLGETELRDTKQQFWRRYKMRFPPEVRPADATISRVASGERVASSWIRLWGLSTTTSTSHWHAGSVGGLGRTQPEDP